MPPYNSYWSCSHLSDDEDRSESSDSPLEGSISVSADSDGFWYVLARPNGSERTIALSLSSNPEPGVFVFHPVYEQFEFEVQIEYKEKPYPAAKMQTLDLTSPLCNIEVGDSVEILLRKDITESPGVKSITGEVIRIVDCCGLVPDTPDYDPESSVVLSVLIDMMTDDSSGTKAAIASDFGMQRRLNPVGDSNGTLDIVGTEYPLDLQWEGASDTPALQVEKVIISSKEGEWAVENELLPEVQFNPLEDFSQKEKVERIQSIFERVAEISVSSDKIAAILRSVGDSTPQVTLTVDYASSKSSNILSKSGKVDSVASVYYADANQTRYQIRFVDGSQHYLLLNPEPDATSPIGLYSKSYSRHWDTDLGDVQTIDVSAGHLQR